MTTIAFDGTTLAADRCAWSSGNRYRVRKVYKVRAPDGRLFLVAFCGQANYCMAVLDWMRGGPRPGEYPNKDGTYTIAVVIDEQRRIWRMESDYLTYTQVLEKVHACGAGQDFAIGALEAGATAAEAIRITMKRSDLAGLGVDTVRF
jgi:ATP-dependent HslUV protease subunit HslV